ncbi:unnamed protein product [Symbiodinium natans]|uniref:Uncharacterized protein n=1 Tax=Symbiodinium natans TaxID=878477 RepID=A0A812M0C6_9DINO|nr:unnamed protein product [Symbiodinium natans]
MSGVPPAEVVKPLKEPKAKKPRVSSSSAAKTPVPAKGAQTPTAKSPKTPKSEKSTGSAVPPSDDAILESFMEPYRELIERLPLPLFPRSTRHGLHSYTQPIRKAKVEVLLRQKALKPKTNMAGENISCRSQHDCID